MKFKAMILKLGKRCIRNRSYKKNTQSFYIPSFAKNVVDPVGAGDALLAYSSLAFYFSNCMINLNSGNIAAAIECERDGNIPVNVNDVIKKLKEIENFQNLKKINECSNCRKWSPREKKRKITKKIYIYR